MSYQIIKEKLDNRKLVILDGAMGSELEKSGAKMDKNLWCGTCSVEFPELVRKVHEDYIEAGADVITTNTYASTPISMKNYGLEDSIERFNQKSVEIAKKAIENSKKKIALAGSVSASGSYYKLGVKAMIPGFNEQLKILSDAGVDLIILEAMTSKDETVESIIECSSKINLPVWLSISCAMNNEEGKLMHGYQESVTNSKAQFYDYLENSLLKFTQLHKGPILVAHSDIKVTSEAVKILKKIHKGSIGAYPNNGYFEKPNWKLVDDISPSSYLEEAKSWVLNGAQIIGGCCGVGPDKIKAISVLK